MPSRPPLHRPLGAIPLAVAFLAVHAAIAWVDVADTLRQPAGDVTGVYRFWVDTWHATGVLVGVDTAWVYPIGALPPMLLAGVLGGDAYLAAWLVLVTALDAVALVLLARRSRPLALWWIAFTALLGPVALVRIDAVALPIAIAGVLAVASRPGLAAVLLTVATWVKVWPAAVLAALMVAGRRTSTVVAAAAFTSAAVIGLAVAAGARGSVFSFVSAQAARGLQVEAPAALPWLWSAALGDGGVRIYYDTALLTFQVRGAGVAAAAAATNPLLAAGVLAVVVLALVARRRGADPGEVLAVSALGLVAAVVALNKVGSPQYLTWYVAPVLLGLLVAPRRFRPIAIVVLVAAGLTQAVYPWSYGGVVAAQPAVVALLTLRDLIEVVLLGWSLVGLAALRAPAVLRTGAIAVRTA